MRAPALFLAIALLLPVAQQACAQANDKTDTGGGIGGTGISTKSPHRLASPRGFQLVTEEEARRSREAPPMLEADLQRPDPLAPQILVVDPKNVDQVLRNPFRMELIFQPQPGAKLDFSSFRAFYGALKLDITDRILREATRTGNGLRVVDVRVPSGSHKIILRIRDDQNRVAEKELQIRVD